MNTADPESDEGGPGGQEDESGGTIREDVVTGHREKGQLPVATPAGTTAAAAGAGCPWAASRTA